MRAARQGRANTAGPSLDALIKVINTVSLLLAGLIATSGGILPV